MPSALVELQACSFSYRYSLACTRDVVIAMPVGVAAASFIMKSC